MIKSRIDGHFIVLPIKHLNVILLSTIKKISTRYSMNGIDAYNTSQSNRAFNCFKYTKTSQHVLCLKFYHSKINQLLKVYIYLNFHPVNLTSVFTYWKRLATNWLNKVSCNSKHSKLNSSLHYKM